jgi:hypothetical protein
VADPVENAKNRLMETAAKDVARRALEDLTLPPEEKQRRDVERAGATRKRNIKLVLGLTAVVVVGIGVMTLLARLWFYAMALAVVGGVGFAGYLAVRPRVLELRAARERKQLAAAQEAQREATERHAKDAAQAAADAKLAEARKLEDQLAALKKKA